MTRSSVLETVSRAVDVALDRTVVPGFTALGLAVRRRLPGWPADPPPGALTGRHVAVTGATSGLGRRTALDLAALGATVHLVVRDTERGEGVAADVDAAVGREGAARVWRCDVGDLDSVRGFADAFLAADVPLRGLVHNAGALPAARTESAQGHELTQALHVLGPVLMTELLLPSLEADAGRVVLVTSGGMYTQALPADDPEYRRGGLQRVGRVRPEQARPGRAPADPHRAVGSARGHRPRHAPRVGEHAGAGLLAAPLLEGAPSRPAHGRRRSRHHRLGGRHRARGRERPTLARPANTTGARALPHPAGCR